MKIGILQTGRTPENAIAEHGDYDDFFKRFLGGKGLEFETYAVLDGIFPGSVEDADGWLITGSRFGAYEAHDWIPPLEDFLREAYARSVPIVGVCFGHQILAQALGGKVEKYKGGWSTGVEKYDFDGFDDPISLIAWHQDQVTELPPNATVVGSSDFCPYAALAYGDRAWTVQPHPEFEPAFAYDLIEARRAILPEGMADRAEASLDQPTMSAAIAELIARFFKQEA